MRVFLSWLGWRGAAREGAVEMPLGRDAVAALVRRRHRCAEGARSPLAASVGDGATELRHRGPPFDLRSASNRYEPVVAPLDTSVPRIFCAMTDSADPPNPLDLPEEEQVVYELGGWSLDLQAEAAEVLAESQIPHAWDGTDLV